MKSNKKRFWIRPIHKIRSEKGEFANLVNELRTGDREYFFRYFHMSPERFDDLLTLVKIIAKQNTRFRKAIPAEERLAVTLRFLATGDAQQSLSFFFRIGRSTISNIISETCESIYLSMKDSYKTRWLATFKRHFLV